MAELMTVEELSKYLRLTKRTIYRLLRQGNMPAAKVGHRWRFDREAIDNWFRRGATGAYGRVLVIDDDPAIGRLFAGTLEERGYSVIALQTAHEAMELVQRTNFGHIFVDLDMPKIKGPDNLAPYQGGAAGGASGTRGWPWPQVRRK
jgi:excisionase family DNA binding protein